jgi:tRNA threonylcarbamoyladenosine biosynthesis protein TsaB
LTTLSLDTATPAPSLALLKEGEPLLERNLTPSPGAGRRLAHELHLLLVDAGLPLSAVEEIVVGLGPGGFTGLRIGIATALGLGQALHIPVVGVASIEALAAGMAIEAPDGSLLVPVIDAKRNEVFAAGYRVARDGGLETVFAPVATTSAGLAEELAPIASADAPAWLAGDGLHRLTAILRPGIAVAPEGSPAHRISAVQLARRAWAGGDRPVVPLYLRLPDAEVNRLRREHEAATA